jgi:ATP-dependent DNA helicase RecG
MGEKIKNLIKSGESESLEFKSSLADINEIVEDVSAFSNSKGGNPGPFPEGVSPEKPIHKPRNPILCQLIRDVGFIEKYGSGIYFMKNLCKEWGMQEPEYEITETKTKVIFKSARESILISEIEKIGVRINLRQKKALEYALKEGFLTNKFYREINKVSDETARRELSELVKEGLLKVVGKGRDVKYLPKI